VARQYLAAARLGLPARPFRRAADVVRDGCLAAVSITEGPINGGLIDGGLIAAVLVRRSRPVGNTWSSVLIVFHVAE